MSSAKPHTTSQRRFGLFRGRKRTLGALAALAGISAVVIIALSTQNAVPLIDAGADATDTCDIDIEDQLDQLGVPGLAAAIVKDGEIACVSVAGYSEISDRRPVTPDTLFLVASVSKTVTATALMQLYERGRFRLDDDINDYLPFEVEIPAAPDEAITFRHLLTHTSSLKDNPIAFNTFTEYGADPDLSLAELLEDYLTPEGDLYSRFQNFIGEEPGTEHRYANINFVLIGYLVEVISGQPFDEYCRSNIFRPLSMHHSGWKLADIEVSSLATPYESSWFGYDAIEQYGQANYPDGMLRTSVVELSRFVLAYLDNGIFNFNRVLQSSTIDEMLKQQTPVKRNQGFGWFSRTIDDRTVWGHDGTDDGASAQIWLYPQEETAVIIMANGPWDNEDQLLELLFAEAESY